MLHPLWCFFFTVGTIAGWVSSVSLTVADFLDDIGQPRVVVILAVIGFCYLFRSALGTVFEILRFFSG